MSDKPSKFTPADFDGIFYSEDSGSEAIFDLGGEFVELIRERRDGLFLALGAHVDLRVYGKRPDIADAILERARAVWTDANWTEIDQMFVSIDQLRSAQPHGWRHTVYEMVQASIMPKSHKMPEQFVSYFYDAAIYELLFGMRAAAFNTVKTQGGDLCVAVKLLVGLYLNDQTELREELEEALPYFWGGIDERMIRELYLAAETARSTSTSTWPVALEASIEIAIRGFGQVGDRIVMPMPTRRVHAPPDFQGIFLSGDSLEALFAQRENVVNIFVGRPEAPFVLAAMIIDLRINNYGELADSLLARARELWTDFDFTKVEAVITQAAELASLQADGWQEAIHQLAHAELEPKIPELPESYQSYFVPRRVLEFLYANGPIDGLGMMQAAQTELYRVVKTMVVMNLNDDHAFVAALEATLPRFYPEADIERIRRLYTEVRDIKASYGEHWLTFANAHIDMAIRGHADITWIEGAA